MVGRIRVVEAARTWQSGRWFWPSRERLPSGTRLPGGDGLVDLLNCGRCSLPDAVQLPLSRLVLASIGRCARFLHSDSGGRELVHHSRDGAPRHPHRFGQREALVAAIEQRSHLGERPLGLTAEGRPLVGGLLGGILCTLAAVERGAQCAAVVALRHRLS